MVRPRPLHFIEYAGLPFGPMNLMGSIAAQPVKITDAIAKQDIFFIFLNRFPWFGKMCGAQLMRIYLCVKPREIINP